MVKIKLTSAMNGEKLVVLEGEYLLVAVSRVKLQFQVKLEKKPCYCFEYF
jgi:hypothetical protein